MGQVNVTLNGRTYVVGCDDGDEDHIKYLGDFIGKKMVDLVSRVGQVGEARLLLMVALMVADDLAAAYDDIEGLQAEIADLRAGMAAVDQDEISLERLVRRLEDIAARLENA